MEKEKYTPVEMEVIFFDVEDIITVPSSWGHEEG